MDTLFSTFSIGEMQLKNRFVHSATHEGMSAMDGKVTDPLIARYKKLAQGEIGLIIPGYLFVHPLGRNYDNQCGIHNDGMIPGLKKLTEAVHEKNGKIVFQLVHAGRQTTKDVIGQTPLGPSSVGRDPVNFVKPKEMNEQEIWDAIKAFGQAAKRAALAGADGVQINACHGFLINQFLSPFFNRRRDAWGGTDEKRFRFLKEVLLEIKRSIPENMPVLIKLNTNDYTPKPGINPDLAVIYAKWLAELGIDAIEVSAGSTLYCFMNITRGDVPTKEIVMSFPFWKKPFGSLLLKSFEGKFDLYEGYNVEAAKKIKPHVPKVPIIVVGGLRNVNYMEKILENNSADLVAMSRPFIREPLIVQKFKEKKTDTVACVSCNKCLASLLNDLPLRCYINGYPKKGG